ncbi:MAG TPA: hypothetical protein VMB50_20445 [Myxococcales bacterium]|nr:hypothetical protein [Myxococcales bacterium]
MRTSTAAISFLALASCAQLAQDVDAGLGDLQKAEANHAAAITVLRSPPVPLPDGGVGPSVTGLSVFFGSVSAATVTSAAPSGIPGATVTATDSAGMHASCLDLGNGTYVATSIDGGASYDPGASYTFTVALAGQSYVATGTAPPPETVPAFETPYTDGGLPVFAQIAAGAGYTLTRASASKLAVAFVAVNALTAGTPSANPTWTNLPQTPLALLQLVVDDSQWRSATVAIPASAFPSPGLYLVSLTAVNEGSPQSSNLFLGSPVLIGAASAGILQVQ